jgi:betaine-aldehyde dehydrogenase
MSSQFQNIINGKPVPSRGPGERAVLNPSTGQTLAQVTNAGPAEVADAVGAAESAFHAWSRLTPAARHKVLAPLADMLAEHAAEIVDLEVANAGKPVAAFRDEEFPDCVDGVRLAAAAGRNLTANASGEYLDGVTSSFRREPIGVVGAITPWNYPLLQAIAKIVPALAVGNTMVIKPSEITPLSTVRFVEIANEVLPPGVLNVVTGDGPGTGAALTSDPRVGIVSFTGSVAGGRAVAVAAAQGLRKSVMELGGNAPAVVFADADIPRAARLLAASGLFNCGQECMASSRVLVEESAHDELVAGLRAEIETVVLGDARDEETTLGPMISQKQLDRALGLLERRPGTAQVLTGGKRSHGDGFFLEPTLVTGLRQDDELVQTEVFAPVITVQPFRGEEQALAMANGTAYGLSASVWSSNTGRTARFGRDLRAGMVWVNEHPPQARADQPPLKPDRHRPPVAAYPSNAKDENVNATAPSWRNWGLNQSCEPARIASPATPDEVAHEVRTALAAGWTVRAAGAGHSIMPIVPTDGLLIDPSRLNGITSVDPAGRKATILAGTPLRDLGPQLWEAGLGLANQGDIDIQTITGATSTGTKGSGVNLTNLAARITMTELVDASGELRRIDSGDELSAAQVSLGLLGVITQLEVQLQPRYFLREQYRVMAYEDLLEQWDELKLAHRHFSFWWMPNERAHALYGFDPVPTDHALVKLLDEVDIDDSCELRRTPEGRIGRSYLVYPDTTTDPTFHELEYMLPATRDKEGFSALRELMLAKHPDVDSPVQIRWQKQDEAWLSPQHRRETVSVSVSGVIGTDYTPFFREVQALLLPMEARPHWGKWNAFTTEDIAPVYPRFDDFRRLRAQFDPEGRFANGYLRQLFKIDR